MPAADRPKWNHNIHFHPVVLDAIPAGARSALDVGTGNGLLAAELRARMPEVVGVDVDPGVLAEAEREHRGIHWLRADAMSYDFGRRFDVVASVATLHHLPDLRAALARFAELTEPGGVVAIVGIARASTLADHARSLVGAVQHWWYARTREVWEHTAPTVWPPPHTYREVRRAVADVLPGARWRQFALWRYAVVWHKPERAVA